MAVNFQYTRHGDLILEGTLHRPSGSGPFPAVVSVHGGAWTSGDRTGNLEMDEALRDAGFAVFAVDFRMPPDAAYPAAVEDVRASIHWLKREARELQISPLLVGALGASSGAQTVLLCALQPYPGDELAFVIACWPIADPVARYQMAKARGLTKLVAAHESYFGDEATMRTASPQRIIAAGEASALPPLLILQGTADESVTSDMAENLRVAYAAAGGRAELQSFEGQPHSFVKTGDPETAGEAKRRMTDFARRCTTANHDL